MMEMMERFNGMDEMQLVEELYRVAYVVARRQGIIYHRQEELVQNAVVEMMTKKFESIDDLYQLIADSKVDRQKSNWLYTILKNSMLTRITYENYRDHNGLAYNDHTEDENDFIEYNGTQDTQTEIDESFMILKDMINSFGIDTTERKYLISKSYFEGVRGIETLMDDELTEMINRIESKMTSKFKRNTYEIELLSELGLGYAGNTKARSFKNNLRNKIVSLGYRN